MEPWLLTTYPSPGMILQVSSEEPVAGPPAWRFSVKLARVRAKPKETRRTTSFAVKTNKMVDDVALR